LTHPNPDRSVPPSDERPCSLRPQLALQSVSCGKSKSHAGRSWFGYPSGDLRRLCGEVPELRSVQRTPEEGWIRRSRMQAQDCQLRTGPKGLCHMRCAGIAALAILGRHLRIHRRQRDASRGSAVNIACTRIRRSVPAKVGQEPDLQPACLLALAPESTRPGAANCRPLGAAVCRTAKGGR
jgi:hypothetical protein